MLMSQALGKMNGLFAFIVLQSFFLRGSYSWKGCKEKCFMTACAAAQKYDICGSNHVVYKTTCAYDCAKCGIKNLANQSMDNCQDDANMTLLFNQVKLGMQAILLANALGNTAMINVLNGSTLYYFVEQITNAVEFHGDVDEFNDAYIPVQQLVVTASQTNVMNLNADYITWLGNVTRKLEDHDLVKCIWYAGLPNKWMIAADRVSSFRSPSGNAYNLSLEQCKQICVNLYPKCKSIAYSKELKHCTVNAKPKSGSNLETKSGYVWYDRLCFFQGNRNGTCPTLNQNKMCMHTCNKDSDCAQTEKCCFTGCGKTCTRYTKPGEHAGFCPAKKHDPNCISDYCANNGNDRSCSSNKKCCDQKSCQPTCLKAKKWKFRKTRCFWPAGVSHMYIDYEPMREKLNLTERECKLECEKRHPKCRSMTFHRETGECLIYEVNCRTQPEVLKPEHSFRQYHRPNCTALAKVKCQWTKKYGWNFKGKNMDYSRSVQGLTVDQCKYLCEKKLECKSIVTISEGQYCYLKSTDHEDNLELIENGKPGYTYFYKNDPLCSSKCRKECQKTKCSSSDIQTQCGSNHVIYKTNCAWKCAKCHDKKLKKKSFSYCEDSPTMVSMFEQVKQGLKAILDANAISTTALINVLNGSNLYYTVEQITNAVEFHGDVDEFNDLYIPVQQLVVTASQTNAMNLNVDYITWLGNVTRKLENHDVVKCIWYDGLPNKWMIKADQVSSFRSPTGTAYDLTLQQCATVCEDLYPKCKSIGYNKHTQHCTVNTKPKTKNNLEKKIGYVWYDHLCYFQGDREGTCPAMNQRKRCRHECEKDSDCALTEKCCFTGCGKMCTRYTKPGEHAGVCPAQPDQTVCNKNCQNDASCSDSEKCCGCGPDCVKAKQWRFKKTKCSWSRGLKHRYILHETMEPSKLKMTERECKLECEGHHPVCRSMTFHPETGECKLYDISCRTHPQLLKVEHSLREYHRADCSERATVSSDWILKKGWNYYAPNLHYSRNVKGLTVKQCKYLCEKNTNCNSIVTFMCDGDLECYLKKDNHIDFPNFVAMNNPRYNYYYRTSCPTGTKKKRSVDEEEGESNRSQNPLLQAIFARNVASK